MFPASQLHTPLLITLIHSRFFPAHAHTYLVLPNLAHLGEAMDDLLHFEELMVAWVNQRVQRWL